MTERIHPVSDATPDLALYDLPALASEPVPATGNPEEIDVDALARALHEASPASHFRRKCRDDHYLRAEAIAAEYARQREGERP